MTSYVVNTATSIEIDLIDLNLSPDYDYVLIKLPEIGYKILKTETSNTCEVLPIETKECSYFGGTVNSILIKELNGKTSLTVSTLLD